MGQRAPVVLTWLVFAAGVSCRRAPTTGRHYYGHLERIPCPPVPAREIDRAALDSAERDGTGYYAADFDDQGRLVRIERRLRGKQRFVVEYAYRDGGIEERGSGEYFPSCARAPTAP
jgi:hypothetical protein